MTEMRRLESSGEACQVPQPSVRHGWFEVDATWGKVQPIEPAAGVRTIGELELIEHVEGGGEIIDTRIEKFAGTPTIPGSRRISHEEIGERITELDPARPVVFFCNGPQCAATPDAISILLDAGHPPGAILYYRGGLHDWMTLGYPTVSGS